MPSLKMLLYAGGVHILAERVHILTQGVRILTLGVVFFIKSSSYVTFLIIYYHAIIIILSVCFHRIYQSNMSKSPFLSGTTIFFHPVGSPDVILTFSPSL